MLPLLSVMILVALEGGCLRRPLEPWEEEEWDLRAVETRADTVPTRSGFVLREREVENNNNHHEEGGREKGRKGGKKQETRGIRKTKSKKKMKRREKNDAEK